MIHYAGKNPDLTRLGNEYSFPPFFASSSGTSYYLLALPNQDRFDLTEIHVGTISSIVYHSVLCYVLPKVKISQEQNVLEVAKHIYTQQLRGVAVLVSNEMNFDFGLTPLDRF